MNNCLYYKNVDSINIAVNKKEVLRYLGYGNAVVDETTEILINNSIRELKEISSMKYVYGFFDMEKNNNYISLINSKILLKGRDILNHLKTSEKSVVMAVTLGIEVEKKIKYYSVIDLTKGIVFDACATAMVEELCDYVEGEIKEFSLKKEYYITSRYSPGYGDLPLSIQSEVLNSLNAQRLIGLTTTESSILLPRKSVTAFIGLTKEKPNTIKNCSDCNLYGNCKFSKGGMNCAK